MSDGFFESKKRNVAGLTIVTRADSQEELEFMTLFMVSVLVSPSIPVFPRLFLRSAPIGGARP